MPVPYSSLGRAAPTLTGCYNVTMDAEAQVIETQDQLDELTYEPVREPELDPAMGIILESLRRREPTMTIR
jgi:hypothetical protein